MSFFERYGSAGFAALEDVLTAARAAGLIVIADAKRGDIGSTMDAYAEAWLTPGSPLEADAMTANPFLGVGTLDGTFALAEASGKGVFVLAATSNPEAFPAQRAALLGAARTVSAAIVAEVSERNARTTPDGRVGEPRLRHRRHGRLGGCRPHAVRAARADPRPRVRASGRGTRRSRPPVRRSGAVRHREREPQPAGRRPGGPRRGDRGPHERLP